MITPASLTSPVISNALQGMERDNSWHKPRMAHRARIGLTKESVSVGSVRYSFDQRSCSLDSYMIQRNIFSGAYCVRITLSFEMYELSWPDLLARTGT